MTQTWVNGTDEFIVLDDGVQKKKLSSEIFGSNAFNSTAFTTNTGTVTSVSVGTGLDISSATTTPSITLDLDELADMTQAWVNSTDEFIVLDDGTQKKKLSSEIFGSNAFNSTAFTTNTGTTTADNSQTFTNKTGNISQWTNNSNYSTTTGTVTGTGATNQYARWNSATGLQGRTTAQVLSDIGAAASSHGTHLDLGSTSTTAHRGDQGAIAYTHSQATHANVNATTNTGTVTSVATSGSITGGTITGTGTISHVTTTGHKHIPSGGSANQVLTYSADGTAAWANAASGGVTSISVTTTAEPESADILVTPPDAALAHAAVPSALYVKT
jgi:hypothetical protein